MSNFIAHELAPTGNAARSCIAMKRHVDHGAMAISGHMIPWQAAAGTRVALYGGLCRLEGALPQLATDLRLKVICITPWSPEL